MRGPKGPFFICMKSKASSSAQHDRAGLVWLLLAAFSALPWLIAPAGQPWPGFHRDWLQAVVWLVVGGALTLCVQGRWTLTPAAITLGCVSAIPMLQASAGLFIDLGDAILPTLVLAGTALAIAIAGQAQRTFPLRLADSLFAGILVASVVSTGLAILQLQRMDLFGPLIVAGLPGGRQTANLGQPNLLATLLLWGLVGAAWGYWRGQLGRVAFLLLSATLLLGIVLTQSRTGALGVVVLALFVALAKRKAGLALPVGSLTVLGLAFLLIVAAWPALNAGLTLEGSRALSDVGSGGKRPAIWSAMFGAIAQAPWVGYGWNQGIAAHLAVAASLPPLNVIIGNAHNFILDLLVWTGVPIGILLSLGILVWYSRRMLLATDAPRWLIMAALSVFGIHASLELPHMLVVLLVPLALMVGTLEGLEGASTRWAPKKNGLVFIAAVFLVLSAQLIMERQRLVDDLLAHRMARAGIGDVTIPQAPLVFLLGSMQRSLVAQRIEPRSNMPEEELDALDRGALRFAAAGALFNAAQAAALNNQPARAKLRLVQLCSVHSTASCAGARDAWVEIGASDRGQALRAVPFPVPLTK